MDVLFTLHRLHMYTYSKMRLPAGGKPFSKCDLMEARRILTVLDGSDASWTILCDTIKHLTTLGVEENVLYVYCLQHLFHLPVWL